MAYLTVCTPTYNRSNTLHRPFNSLCMQSFKDFEWLIIDDGSTDDTSELVQSFLDKADFSIKYVKKENGGRASALNISYQYINTRYVINLDSDDELLPDALEKIHNIWEEISEKKLDNVWCVVGHCIDQQGKLIGKLWPTDINMYVGKKQHKKIILNKRGAEKSCCRRVDILKKYPFPVLDGTKFVPENIVWERINLEYDQYCVNDIFRRYYTDSPDSLAKARGLGKEKYLSYYYLALFYLNYCFEQIYYNNDVLTAIPVVCGCSMLGGLKYKKVMNDIDKVYKKIIVSFFWLPMKIYCLFKRKKNGIQ